jgi:hypothetical protein
MRLRQRTSFPRTRESRGEVRRGTAAVCRPRCAVRGCSFPFSRRKILFTDLWAVIRRTAGDGQARQYVERLETPLPYVPDGRRRKTLEGAEDCDADRATRALTNAAAALTEYLARKREIGERFPDAAGGTEGWPSVAGRKGNMETAANARDHSWRNFGMPGNRHDAESGPAPNLPDQIWVGPTERPRITALVELGAAEGAVSANSGRFPFRRRL